MFKEDLEDIYFHVLRTMKTKIKRDLILRSLFHLNYTALIYNSVLNLRTLISPNAPAAIVIELTFFLTVYPETDEGRVIVIFEDAEL